MRRLVALLLLCCVCGLSCSDEEIEEPAVAPQAPPGRVLLIGIDGASPRLTTPLISEGRLPNLARLAGQGVSGKLRSAKPIDSPRIWNTIATGKVPGKHGINHFASRDEEGNLKLYLSSDRKVHALWNIVSDAGMTVGVVNFWNTYPPELVNGVMISDHLLARNIEGRLRITGADAVPRGPLIHPADWLERLETLLAEGHNPTSIENPLRDNPALPAFVGLVGEDFPRRFEEDGVLARFAKEIDDVVRPDLLMVLLPGIDRTSHFLWGSLEDPERYDTELRFSKAEQEAARSALETYYEYTDALIGLLMKEYDENDLVIVLSDHGFEAGRGMGLLTGVHETEAALDGVLFARGAGLLPGTEAGELSVVDVTPTVLAWLGLPVGEDMDGRPAAFLGQASFATVPTHDTGAVNRMALGPSGAEDEIVNQLRSLGYLE